MNWWRMVGLLCMIVPWLLIGGIVHTVKVVWETPASVFLTMENPPCLPVLTAGVRAADKSE